MHNLPLITTLAMALGSALIMGLIAVKLKLPTLVGYLLAGILIGPFTPGFVANLNMAAELAEIGVMLLMFGVGLHFSLDELLETRRIALPGALIQILAATSLSTYVFTFWGWNFKSALVFGLALSVASTVVMIRALDAQNLLRTLQGQIAVGWLIVEDLAMVLVLVFLPFIAQWTSNNASNAAPHNLWIALGLTFFKISSFIVVMLWVGRWALPKLLLNIIHTKSRELFTLCIIAAAVSMAFAASKLFDVSFALGAFFAGMMIRESRFSQRAAEESLPFREAFSALFFVSVGMLFNPHIFLNHPLEILAVVSIIILGKSIAASTLVLILRYPLKTALTVSASLAQIGEFSFILVGQSVALKLLPPEGRELILAGALISITLNPFLFKSIIPLENWLQKKFAFFKHLSSAAQQVSAEQSILSDHVILVGYGKVGKEIAKLLSQRSIPYVIIEHNHRLEKPLKRRQHTVILGNAAEPSILEKAHIQYAKMLVVTTTDHFNMRQMLDIAQKINPQIEIEIRVQSKEEKHLLDKEINGKFFLDKEELAKNMAQHILDRFQKT